MWEFCLSFFSFFFFFLIFFKILYIKDILKWLDLKANWTFRIASAEQCLICYFIFFFLFNYYYYYSPFLYYGTNYVGTSALLSRSSLIFPVSFLPLLKFKQFPNFCFPEFIYLFIFSISLILDFDSTFFFLLYMYT